MHGASRQITACCVSFAVTSPRWVLIAFRLSRDYRKFYLRNRHNAILCSIEKQMRFAHSTCPKRSLFFLEAAIPAFLFFTAFTARRKACAKSP